MWTGESRTHVALPRGRSASRSRSHAAVRWSVRTRRSSAAPRRRAPDVDIHAFVLDCLDQHLAALHEVRAGLTAARATAPGLRLLLVSGSVCSARRYLNLVEALLTGVPDCPDMVSVRLVGGAEPVDDLVEGVGVVSV
jgi:hypothetical protein